MLVLCLTVFFGRIIDVTLGTIRTLLTVKGKRLIAAAIGFVEVTIWFLVVKEALNTDIKSIWIAFSYAGGYALGTFIGTTLSNKLIDGKISAQVIINSDSINEVEKIRKAGFAVSQIDCTGKDNAKK